MNYLKSASLGLILLASAGGVAFAQTGSMSGDHMMASKGDMMKMDHCKSMHHRMMMKSHTCMKMMKMHPDMMKGDAMMDKGAMAPK